MLLKHTDNHVEVPRGENSSDLEEENEEKEVLDFQKHPSWENNKRAEVSMEEFISNICQTVARFGFATIETNYKVILTGIATPYMIFETDMGRIYDVKGYSEKTLLKKLLEEGISLNRLYRDAQIYICTRERGK